jgi:hypothetical protein
MKNPITAGLTALVVCAFAAPATSQEPPAQGSVILLQLRDGRVQWGTLQSHDPEGFVFSRLDNGGVARLSWGMLDPVQEHELELQLGYVDLTGDEYMIDADQLVTTGGTPFTGVIVDRTADAILMKTLGSTVTIRKDQIGGASTTVRVPARDVYTKQELYDQQMLAEPPNDAAGHYAMGQFCERIFDFAHAVEHYKLAAADPKFRPSEVPNAIARATEKGKSQDQLDYLSDVDSDMRQKKFDKALARADAFQSKFPTSALIAEAKKKHDQIIKARDREIATQVARQWLSRSEKLAHKAALTMTFDQAVAYVEEPMKQELLDAVLKDVQQISKDVTADMVKQMWAARKKVRYNRASYGLGTWLLGKDGALKGMDDEKEKKDKEKAKQDTEISKERADFQKKVEQFLKNQEMTRKAQSKDEQKEDREGFWKDYGALSKGQWLLAYFVENSGLFELAKHPILDNCSDCGGKGTREIAVVGSNVAKSMVGKGQTGTTAECPVCHGIGRVRRISFR